MLLKASTQYTEQVVRDYLWLNLCPRRQYRVILPVIFFGLVVLLITSAVLFFVLRGQLFLTLAIVFLAAALVLGNQLFLNPRKQYRRRHSQIQSPNDYTFFNNHFVLRSERTVDAETEFVYSDLDHALETDDYFLLYTMRRKGCMVGKLDFTEGRPADLREQLQEKLGNRFSRLTSAG